ncbi:MAG: hypothetical protein CM1200mP17_10920 [Woeseia sp.]|nr:MAG: hypothetical protein CM1200mP17_10920 [Woeseia sp.]
MRRIITGHNNEGKSVIKIDGPPLRSVGEDVGGLFEIWNTDGNPIDSLDAIDRTDTEIILSPSPGGSKFRYFKINPTPEGVPRDVLEELAAQAFKRALVRSMKELTPLDTRQCIKQKPLITSFS